VIRIESKGSKGENNERTSTDATIINGATHRGEVATFSLLSAQLPPIKQAIAAPARATSEATGWAVLSYGVSIYSPAAAAVYRLLYTYSCRRCFRSESNLVP